MLDSLPPKAIWIDEPVEGSAWLPIWMLQTTILSLGIYKDEGDFGETIIRRLLCAVVPWVAYKQFGQQKEAFGKILFLSANPI